jgi:hypothetical protein
VHELVGLLGRLGYIRVIKRLVIRECGCRGRCVLLGGTGGLCCKIRVTRITRLIEVTRVIEVRVIEVRVIEVTRVVRVIEVTRVIRVIEVTRVVRATRVNEVIRIIRAIKVTRVIKVIRVIRVILLARIENG